MKSSGRADVSLLDIFGAPAIMLVRTVEVRRGIGLSGSLDCLKSGRNEAYGLACSDRALESAGIPMQY